MIRCISILCFICCIASKLAAQQYGNEWINYSQKYFKISIAKTGLYRIDSITLANSGVPLSAINPKNLQLFIKGQEQHIYINGENDGVFNATDYLEFYAEKNDASFDSIAYYNISRMPNPYYALFNDTNYAYLSWNNSLANKRMLLETDVNFNGYAPTDYFYSEKIFSFNSAYSAGYRFQSIISDPRYVSAEGYGAIINQGQTQQPNFGFLNVYQSSSLPVYFKTCFSGNSQDFIGNPFDHQIKFEYYDNNGNYVTLNDTTFLGYVQINVEKQITSDKLQNNSFARIKSVNNPLLSSITNETNVHYITCTYPKKTDFMGSTEQLIYVYDNASSFKTFLNVQNVSVGTSSVICYDITNHKYITTSVNSGNVRLLIPNSGGIKKCLLTTSGNVISVTNLSPVNQTGFFINYKTSNPDSAYLIISHKGLMVSANDYKQYRESPAGGANHVILAFVDDLYDQFAYGNTKNPLSIRNFCRYLTDSLSAPPKYLLLLGKSIKNTLVRSNNVYWSACDLPTMGIPASDNLFTTGLNNTNSSTPFIPVGRVSAKTDAQATSYLNKVKAHEYGLSLNEPEDWHKRVLHFSGGIDQPQQLLFQSFLKNYEDTISNGLFGGEVYNFQKTTTAPIQITISDSVKNLIDYGASVITFFGHGSVNGFDQAIDDPNVYNNKDKYPMFIANSCYSGDIHTYEASSTSENFTLISEKGSIGFIASSSTGLVSPLDDYSSELYEAIATQRYYKGIGDAIKYSCHQNSLNNNYQLLEITCLEMTLEGDPYIRLNAFKKPDYVITNSSVSLDAKTYVDSIGIKIDIKNNGMVVKDTFEVRIERTFPNGSSITYLKKIQAPFNSEVLSFNVIKDFTNGVGLNKFKVVIDSYNEIDESSENNNSTAGTVDVFISGGDAVPVFPYKYAIVPKTPKITLKATTADPFAPSTVYKLQLDTVDTFLNPINSTLITSVGGVIEWTVNLQVPDSMVYFWRISKDSIAPTDSYNWRESSFQVVTTKTGWAQAHFHQFKNNTYQFVKYKNATRKFEFENDVKSLECNNRMVNSTNFDLINYKVNNSVEDYYSCAPSGWSFAVFDTSSAKAWEQYNPNPPASGTYGNCICVNYALKSFMFGASGSCGITNWQSNMETFLNSLPNNVKVLAWSVQNHGSEGFNNSLYNAFESLGASSGIRTIKDTVPYIIFGTKGALQGTAHEAMGVNRSSVIQLKDTLKTKWSSGYIASEIIGPSAKWNSLHWKQKPIEFPNTDTILLKVIGIKANGLKDTLVVFPVDSADVYDLDSYANASIYPYMQLVASMKDVANVTPPQLKKWQVMYDQAPECAINPQKGFIANAIMQEGENLVVHLPIENIGTLPFTNSLVVTYWVEDANRVSHPLTQKLKSNPFVSGQVLIDTIAFNTFQYPGLNYLWVDVNPPTNSNYQNEQHHFNNIARIPFTVNADNVNPLLDVTFDGTHILNGDIISSKPHVLITVKDENKFLALNDPTNFAVFIKYPNETTEKALVFGNALQFTPAQLPSNSCKIEWMPELVEDGKYTLIVQATDRSKNASGAVDYKIQFEVVTKQTVTEVLNYPNPFSTATKFVFTLTGNEVPDIFTIQIMTITGKVVKEITKTELGNLHIGRNITEYAWDGKDNFGDKLANGVYLYKIITRHNGQAVEKRQTEADSYFKKGFGKLVIMR